MRVRFWENFRRSVRHLWVKYHSSYMHLMTNYEIYDTFYLSVYVLASFWVCLTTSLIYSLFVHGFFTCDACQPWMNFKIIFWMILVDYVMHLCPYLFMIQFMFNLWVYSLLVTQTHNQENISETLNPIYLIDFIWYFVGLFLWPWKQFLAQTVCIE